MQNDIGNPPKRTINKKYISNILKKTILVGLFAIFIIIEAPIFESIVNSISDIVTIKSAEIWPSSFDPVARFVANIDWETRTVNLDGTISKAYEDKITSYIWRIDDGTGLVNEGMLEHQFLNPGYYTLNLSIIDDHGQSDAASCNILFPPTELERDELTFRPKGTFFNFSKYSNINYDLTEGELLSNYVETDCGLSSRGYNIGGVNANISDRNTSLRHEVALVVSNSIALIVILIIYLIINKFVKKKHVNQ